MRALSDYQKKRDFRATKEPKGKRAGAEKAPIFVVQRHAARRLHFDFRLQVGGTLASWAVPKGPPEEIGEKRLAIHVEDHPIEYAKFEGDIPAGNYGAGHVDIWDRRNISGGRPACSRGANRKGRDQIPPDGQAPERHVCAGEDAAIFAGQRVAVHSEKWSGNAWRSQNRRNAAEKQRQTAPAILSWTLRTLDGAKKAPCPTNISVALAQLSDEVFANPEWLFEIKWDGERALAFIQDGEVEFRSRSARNITPEYPELKSVVKQLNARKAIVDGEIVALDERRAIGLHENTAAIWSFESAGIFAAEKSSHVLSFRLAVL